jgi:serine/threonine-protein kinase
MNDSMYWTGYDRTPARLAQAKIAVDAAVRLRPDAGETHLAQARHAYWGYRDYALARQHLAIARQLLPNSWEVSFLTGLLDRRQGDWESSNRNLERALVLNPRSLQVLNELSGSYSLQRRFDDSLRIGNQIDAVGAKDPYLLIWRPQVDIDRDGNTAPMRAKIDELSRRNSQTAIDLAFAALYLGIYERNAEAARNALMMLPKSEIPGLSGEIYPRGYFGGWIAKMTGKPDEAKEQFTAAHAEAAALVAAQPEDAKAIAVLGLIDAGLGSRDDALRETRRAMELLPMSKDSYDGPLMRMYFAIAAANVGERELAISELQELATIPSPTTYGDLRLNPMWDPLREDPRFEAIMSSLAPARK